MDKGEGVAVSYYKNSVGVPGLVAQDWFQSFDYRNHVRKMAASNLLAFKKSWFVYVYIIWPNQLQLNECLLRIWNEASDHVLRPEHGHLELRNPRYNLTRDGG